MKEYEVWGRDDGIASRKSREWGENVIKIVAIFKK